MLRRFGAHRRAWDVHSSDCAISAPINLFESLSLPKKQLRETLLGQSTTGDARRSARSSRIEGGQNPARDRQLEPLVERKILAGDQRSNGEGKTKERPAPTFSSVSPPPRRTKK